MSNKTQIYEIMKIIYELLRTRFVDIPCIKNENDRSCDFMFRKMVLPGIYVAVSAVGQSTLEKKGWDLMSSTPPAPAPSLSVGLY